MGINHLISLIWRERGRERERIKYKKKYEKKKQECTRVVLAASYLLFQFLDETERF